VCACDVILEHRAFFYLFPVLVASRYLASDTYFFFESFNFHLCSLSFYLSARLLRATMRAHVYDSCQKAMPTVCPRPAASLEFFLFSRCHHPLRPARMRVLVAVAMATTATAPPPVTTFQAQFGSAFLLLLLLPRPREQSQC